MMHSVEKELIWVGSSKKDMSKMPAEVRMSFGYRLRELQDGRTPLDVTHLRQFGHAESELREDFEGNAYRLIYVLNLKKSVYVLHALMKKSKVGIGIPKRDLQLITSSWRGHDPETESERASDFSEK